MDSVASTQPQAYGPSLRAPQGPSNSSVMEDQTADHAEEKSVSANKVIETYLRERSEEFRKLGDLRQKGWDNPSGDAYFQRQRQAADKADDRTAMIFYNLMTRIGRELHQYADAFAIQLPRPRKPAILDMCMAPGGFLYTALCKNPRSRALAFSLPISCGGHKVLLPAGSNVETRFMDITLLAADMDMESIPEDHPDAGNFLPRQFEPFQLFDLVLCDGQVLRTHARAPYRERREAKRLITTQLALGLKHIATGGTMVILLHKLDSWNAVNLVRKFHKFASVVLFKPRSGHATRSSFYMVAHNVQRQHPEAVREIERCKKIWRAATFGSEDENWEASWEGEMSAEELMEAFGPQLVEIGRDVWRVQAEALEKAPFIREVKLD